MILPTRVPGIRTESSNGVVSYYDPGNDQIVIDEKALDDSGVILREFTHHFLVADDQGAKLTDANLSAIESFVAFYFPASFLDQDKIGEIASKKMFDSAKPFIDFGTDAKYPAYAKLRPEERPFRGAEILGAIFWSIRQLLGQAAADKLILSAWREFSQAKSDHSPDAFLRIYLKSFESGENAAHKGDVQRIYRDHGAPA